MSGPEPLLLIVDDETDLSFVLQAHFIARGWQVLTAATGAQGLDLMRRAVPDVVILDMCLPDIGGLAILNEVRPLENDLRVVVLTARMDPEIGHQALGLGAGDFLTKPFDMAQLDLAVDAQFSAKRGLPAPDRPNVRPIQRR